MDRLVYTAAEVAEVLHVSRPVVYTLCRQPGFPCIRIGRKVLVPADKLREWLREQCGTSEEVG